MANYYSTETTLKAKMRADRLRLLGDKENTGDVNPLTLQQGLQFAKSHILAFIWRRYGESVTAAWTEDSAPDLIKALSDDLVIYYLATGANVVNPVVKLNFDMALETLKAIREYQQDISGINDDSMPCTVATAEFDAFPGVTQTALIVR